MSTTFTPDVVNVTVTLESQPLETESFEVPLFITPHNAFTGRVANYTSVDELVAAGFAVGSAAWQFASLAFAGKFAPSQVKIGRQTLTAYQLDFTPYTQTGDAVTITVKHEGVSASFTSVVADTTAVAIASDLATKIEAHATLGALVNAVATAGVLTVSAVTGVLSLGIQSGSADFTTTSTETPLDAYTAIKTEDSEFFYVSSSDHTVSAQEALGAAVAVDHKIFVYSTKDTAALSKTDTTNIGYKFFMSANDWTQGIWNAKANQIYPEGAVIGATAAINFDEYGSDSLHLKTLVNLPVSSLTTTQREALETHNLNYSLMYRKASTYFNGFQGSGQFFDTMKFAAWLDARITESVYNLMKRASDVGASMTASNNDLPRFKAAIRNSPVNVGIQNGSILEGYDPTTNENFDPIIDVPTRGEITVSDLASRILRNLKVEVVYNSPVHYVRVKANVILSRQTA